MLTIVGWLALLFQPSGWLKKVSTLYSLDANLWTVTSSEGVISMGFGSVVGTMSPETEDYLSKLHKREFELQEFREYMCQVPSLPSLGNLCYIWERIQMATWALIFLVLITLLILAIGAGLDCHHHFGHARTKTRKWVRLLYCLAPCFFTVAMLQYWAFASSLEQMPPVMRAGVLGPNVTVAGLLCIISGIPLCIHMSLGKTGLQEEENEQLSAHNKFNRENGFYDGYGANLEGGMNQGQLAPETRTNGSPVQMQQQHMQQQGWQQPVFAPQSAAGAQAPGFQNAAAMWR